MTAPRPFALATLFLLAGCAHPVPKVTIVALDTSLSITPRAEHAAQTAILDQISRLGRGDRLILIPISGDAQNDTGSRILRLVAPVERQAYDNDLRRFQTDAKKQYAAWIASLDQRQMRTDIIGTLDLARQEFAAAPGSADRRLIILSDFLEDDPSYRFVTSPQLMNPTPPARSPSRCARIGDSRSKACRFASGAWSRAILPRSRRSAERQCRPSGPNT